MCAAAHHSRPCCAPACCSRVPATCRQRRPARAHTPPPSPLPLPIPRRSRGGRGRAGGGS
ncbi:hypothetical protein B484DRAFT_451172 [Ochromonadaceae sp. CCMP2298]|nr:hypothetical protein B484DRAFT_451172 [Ochromonadaceae sp. CCMP2298]